MSGSMAGDAIRPFIDQLNLIPKEQKEVDFLIVSNGGDPITSLRIMSLLRERFDKVSVLLPYVAYSAATVLSLGADEIVNVLRTQPGHVQGFAAGFGSQVFQFFG